MDAAVVGLELTDAATIGPEPEGSSASAWTCFDGSSTLSLPAPGGSSPVQHQLVLPVFLHQLTLPVFLRLLVLTGFSPQLGPPLLLPQLDLCCTSWVHFCSSQISS